MKIKSLRFRLTILYFASFFIAIAIIFISFYFTTRQTLFNHTDLLIAAHSNQIKEILVRNPSSMQTPLDENILSQQFGEMPGMIVAITNSRGEIIGGSALSSRSKSIFSRFLTESINNELPRVENSNFESSRMRFMITPIYQNSTFLGTLIIGHPIEVIEKSLQSLIWKLVIIYLIISVIGLMTGSIVAKQALLPVTNISNKMRTITHMNLDDRVDEPKTNDEVQELALTFNDLLDRLNSAFQRERQFMGDVAHELKTPLSILKSRIEVALSKTRVPEIYEKNLLETLRDVNKLDSTLKDILDLALSESDNAVTRMDKINLSEAINELAQTTESLAYKKRIQVDSTIEPDIYISGKKDKMNRAIINVIDNAIKYSDKNSKISIILKSQGREAVLRIKDNGVGISKEDLKHIFDRFYRGSAHNKTHGNGLGLAIVRSVIFAHHGTINAASKENHGTEITITLPLF